MAGGSALQWPDLPIEVVSTGLPDIIMPVKDLESLNAMQPDMAALSALSQELDVVGVHAFALTDDGYTAHVRNFGPLYGVPEESATVMANAALTHYLHRWWLPPCMLMAVSGWAVIALSWPRATCCCDLHLAA